MAIEEVRTIFWDQFPDASSHDLEPLGERLRNPFKKGFRTILYVAESARNHVLGFALLLHEPEIDFCYLDFLASKKESSGRGVGSALYEFIREEAVGFQSKGLFFECLPDDPKLCEDKKLLKENAARLKFYEHYGARPIIGTKYETPVSPGDSTKNLPHLVYDSLEVDSPLDGSFARKVVRAILERKYKHLCGIDYIKEVCSSFPSRPLKLREYRYVSPLVKSAVLNPQAHTSFPVVVSDQHELHHVRERGYVESPVRIRAILNELERSGLARRTPVKDYPLKHIRAVHDPEFVTYLSKACKEVPEGKSIYPYVFPVRNASRLPKEWSVLAGYYCIDTFTPIHRHAFTVAEQGVNCSLTASDLLLKGERAAYALVRPPGHHAERRTFGGFCYFCNCAVAAHYLSAHGRVAILDIDYHHGNGQQDIFYRRRDVLTISIHGDPEFAYPYFTGFEDERGEGDGVGFNANFPLPEQQSGEEYRKVLEKALALIEEFNPTFLVVALGLDTVKGDPTGTWSLSAKDLDLNGAMIGKLQLPTLIVQEGGYRTRTLGANARSFFTGFVRGARWA